MIIKNKIYFSTLTGLLVGGMLFVPLVFSFGYSLLVAGIIVTVLTSLICVGLAFSYHCRCIVALVFPSFFTGKGRGLILSIIFGVMLTGSISHNVRETGRSMACFIDFISNQIGTFHMPEQRITNYVTRRNLDQRPFQKTVPSDMAVLDEVLTALDKALHCIFDTSTAQKKCKVLVNPLFKHCISKCNNRSDRQSNKGSLEDCVFSCNNWKAHVCSALNVSYDFKHIRSTLRMLESSYKGDVEMRVEGYLTKTDNLADSIKSVNEHIKSAINSKISDFQTVMKIMRNILSFYLSLVFLKAYWYFKDYLSKDWYGNNYITKQFMEVNKLYMDANGQCSLPLKKNEKKKYIYTLSLKLNKKEMKHCKIGLIYVFLHLIICTMILCVDYSLFYLLNLVRERGKSEVKLFGESLYHVSVRGDGPIAAYYRRLVNTENGYLSDQTIAKCLPDPWPTTGEHIAVLIGLYVIALCFVILRGYGMRLRRKIAAYFYPEQENARIEYLHKSIQHQRSAHRGFLRQQVMSAFKERLVSENFRLSTRLLRRFPNLAKYAQQQRVLECSSCEMRQGLLHSELTKCAGVQDSVGCRAAYCGECKRILSGLCPLCSCKMDTV